MKTQSEAPAAITVAPGSRTVARRTTRSPVKVWAVVGAGFLVFQFWMYALWIGSGDLEAVPTGPHEVPTWHKIFVYAFWPLSIALMAAAIYYFVIRVWRRDGRLNGDALIALALLTLWFNDPLCNYLESWVTFTTAIPSVGRWAQHMPGWQAEPFSLPVGVTSTVYIYWALPVMCVSCWMMRKAKERWPQLGMVRLLLICFAVNFTFDLATELVWLRLGYWTYAGAARFGTIFYGKYYQLPVIGPMTAAAILTGWAWMRHSRDDRGLTFAERGTDRLRVRNPKTKTLVRFLAIVGCMNVIQLVTYGIPMAGAGHFAEPWPDDIRSRSYLTQNLCQPDFDLCPGLLPPK